MVGGLWIILGGLGGQLRPIIPPRPVIPITIWIGLDWIIPLIKLLLTRRENLVIPLDIFQLILGKTLGSTFIVGFLQPILSFLVGFPWGLHRAPKNPLG